MKRDGQAYKILTQLFEKNNLSVSPSEVQGIICGYLVATEEPCFETWVSDLQDLCDWSSLDLDLQTHIKNMFLAAHVDMVQGTGQITFVAPDSEECQQSQLLAISDWARGCLFGVGLGHLAHEFFENPELEEAVNDLVQIAQISLDVTQTPDMQEDLEHCFAHLEAIVALLHHAAQEPLHEE